MAIINNSLLANTDFPNNLLSCRLIRKNCIVSSLTSSSGNDAGRRKSRINKSIINKIKHFLNDCSSSSQ